MASITQHVPIAVSADEAWAALRQVATPQHLFKPVLVDGRLDGDTRPVQFANGLVLHERLLDVDDKERRMSYAALDGPGMTYHHASMQIVDDGPGHCEFIWITDFLPEDVRDNLTPLIDQGTQAIKRNLER